MTKGWVSFRRFGPEHVFSLGVCDACYRGHPEVCSCTWEQIAFGEDLTVGALRCEVDPQYRGVRVLRTQAGLPAPDPNPLLSRRPRPVLRNFDGPTDIARMEAKREEKRRQWRIWLEEQQASQSPRKQHKKYEKHQARSRRARGPEPRTEIVRIGGRVYQREVQ